MPSKPAGGSGENLPPTRAIGTAGLACDFAVAASRQKFQPLAISLVPYFLLGHSIELSFKAVLIAHGTTDARLRQLGHDLVASRDAMLALGAGTDGPQLDPEDRARIELLSPLYKAKALEYLVPGFMSLPDFDDLLALAERLVRAVQGYVDQAVRTSAGES
jgi:hypothetical protein